jgi:4-nitrophenyl phosphatase
MGKLKKYRALLLDGDGVLWKGDQPLSGLRPFYDFIKERDLLWALLTNSNSHTVGHYIKKFASFGITAAKDSIFTSSTVTAAYLLKRFEPGEYFHVVGSEGLIEALSQAGFEVSWGEEHPTNPVAAVVAGMDYQINYQKIKVATQLIHRGAPFIATNTDASYPTPDGLSPATGMIIAALEAASGVTPEVAGKPHPAIFQAALDSLGVTAADTLMVGDRLDTDIAGAQALGIPTAALLTGVVTREAISQSDLKPDFVFRDLPDLQEALLANYQE